MIGIDIVEIKRVEKTLKFQGFLTKYFSESEREYIKEKHFAPQTVAGMFAAKESVSKALGTGFSTEVSICDIEILHNENDKPYVNLIKGAKAKLNELNFASAELSISHEKHYAVAVCILK